MNKNINSSSSYKLSLKLKDYFQLTKFTLSFTVVFSTVISYLLAPNILNFNVFNVCILFIAGLCITGGANAMNQVLEKDTDSQMKRTASRPIAANRMTKDEGYIFSILMCIIGLGLLYYFFNSISTIIALISYIIYAFIYTPLKKVNSIAVLIGGIPGALPCLIGWSAATGNLSAGGWILFTLQFIWQFPHFWAIAWIAYNDYNKVGFKLLPSSGKPTKITAIQTILYSLLLIPIGIMPYLFGISGITSLIIILVCNLIMIGFAFHLFFTMQPKEAKKIMFGSYIYLPIVLLSLLADKIH